MKNTLKKLLPIIMILVVSFSVAMIASAATVSKVQHKSPEQGGGAATVFYVNTSNKSTAKLQYTTDRAYFIRSDGTTKARGAYTEVLIYGRNSKKESWTYISKTNLKNAGCPTVAYLSMKDYTQYKVRVYSWKTTTIGSYIGGIYDHSGASWLAYGPTCTFKASSSNISSLAK